MIEIVKENADYQKWLSENDAFEQLCNVKSWAGYEDYSCFDNLKTAEELVALYAFVNFVIGVEFVSSVYELIYEEREDGESTTANLVKTFNKQMGVKVI